MANEAIRIMSDDLSALQAHFDSQLNDIKSRQEATNSLVVGNSAVLTQRLESLGRDVSSMSSDMVEVKAQVKATNGRLRAVEADQEYQRGVRAGGAGSWHILVTGGSVLIAAGALVSALVAR